MARILLALAVLTIGFASPALGCEYNLETEKASWASQGMNVGEVSAPKILKAIEVRYGEIIEADQVFVLSKGDAPNVVLVFAALGCPKFIMVVSISDYRAMLKTMGA